jgi:hypothetical protein
MSAGYDIFRNLHHGSPIWIATVATRGKIEQTLNALEWVLPGDYFTRDATNGEIVSGLGPAAPSEASKKNAHQPGNGNSGAPSNSLH